MGYEKKYVFWKVCILSELEHLISKCFHGKNIKVFFLFSVIGPPGTGKTSLCKALAQKVCIRYSSKFRYGHFVEVNTHSLFSKWFSEVFISFILNLCNCLFFKSAYCCQIVLWYFWKIMRHLKVIKCIVYIYF